MYQTNPHGASADTTATGSVCPMREVIKEAAEVDIAQKISCATISQRSSVGGPVIGLPVKTNAKPEKMAASNNPVTPSNKGVTNIAQRRSRASQTNRHAMAATFRWCRRCCNLYQEMNYERCPSPSGRRWPEGPDEGTILRGFHPSPAASRHPLPEVEGCALKRLDLNIS